MKRIDLAGKTFGALQAVRPVPSGETADGRPGWLVRCECGREKVVNADALRRGMITSCGCGAERARRRAATGNEKLSVDYSGQTFGELTALRRAAPGGVWRFRCSCGRETVAKIADVKSGTIQSCGHVLRETARRKIEIENTVEHFDGTTISRLRHIMRDPQVRGIRIRETASGALVYQVRLTLRRREIHVGTFGTLAEAERARREAERVYYLPLIEAWDAQHPHQDNAQQSFYDTNNMEQKGV